MMTFFFRKHLDFRTKMALVYHDIRTKNLNFTNNFFYPKKLHVLVYNAIMLELKIRISYRTFFPNRKILHVLLIVVEWLERRAYDQHDLGSKPARAILLCPRERHFTARSPAWWSWQAVLNFSHILLNYKRTAISWYLRKQVGVNAYPMY